MPFIVRIADLIGNDYDPDGDDFSFVVIDQQGVDGHAFELPDGRWSLTPEGDHNGVATFTYRITDGRGNTVGTNAITVNFAAVNDAPVARADGGYVTAEDRPIEIDLAALLGNDSDVDGDGLSVVGVLDPINGSVTLAGGKAIFTPRADYFGNAGFSYRVADGNGGFATGTVAITVQPDNDLPIAVPDTGWTIDEDTFIDIDPATLIANDVHPDGETIEFIGASGAGVSTLANGVIRFTPSTDANGTFVLTYTIGDSSGDRVSSTFTVVVRPVNDLPVAATDTFSGREDQPVVIPISQLLSNDGDPDGHDISLTGVFNAVGGAVALDGAGNVVFTPNADRNGPVSFEYRITDATGGNATATATINLQPVNDAPEVAAFGPLNGTEDTRLAVQLPASAFSDIDGDTLTTTVRTAGGTSLPSWLIYDPATRGLFGDPPPDFAGVLNLEVVATDGTVSAVRAFQVVITNVNDAPVATDDVIQVAQSQPITIPIASLLTNDTDVDGNPLTVIAVAGGPGVTATLDGSGNVALTRGPNVTGDLSFTYTVSDGEVTDTATVVVTLEDLNDAPVIGTIPARHVAEDAAIDFTLPTDIATDLDGDALSFTATRQGGASLPTWLTFDAQTLRFTGTPPANFFGTIGLTLIVSDGQATASRDFDLVIDPVNDAPVISAPFSDRFVNEDSLFDITLQQGLFSDVDGNPLTYTITLADGSPLPGWITAQHQLLRLQGRAPENFNGSIDIKVTASDGSLSASDYFKLTVNPINDAPVLATPLPDNTITTGKAFSINIPATTFTDPDGDPLQFAAKLANGQALPTWMTFDGTKLTGTAPYAQQGTMDIEILASDGTLQNSDVFRITFERGNSAPVANNDSGFKVRSGAPLTIDGDRLLANDTDADGDALKIVGYSQAGHGSVKLDADGNFTYVTAGGYYGNDQFVYVVSDGKETATATVAIVVDTPYDNTQTGGNGSDMLLGDIFGNSFLSGGSGNDTLLSFFGDDRLMGGAGNDLLYSLSGDDILDGGLGDDQLFAGSGNDILSGGRGNDTLYGGAGRDEFLFSNGDGSDRIADYQARNGDRISLDIEGIDDFDDLLAHAQEQNGGVLLDFGNGDELFLSGTRLAALDRDSFTFY